MTGITREEAEAAVGRKAIYRPKHLEEGQTPEDGIITSVNDRGAFVRYGRDSTSKLTSFEDLELLTIGDG